MDQIGDPVMSRLLILTALLSLAGSCSDSRPVIADAQIWTGEGIECDSLITADRIAWLGAEIKFLRSQRNVYRKMVYCYGQWFQDHPQDSMPDCHGNY